MKNFLNHIDIPEFAKDNKLNVSSLLINSEQIIPNDLVAATALAVLYNNNENELVEILIKESEELTEQLVFGAKAASNIMKMNNIYYRGKHFLGEDYSEELTRLRMNIYSKHGIDKKYFEFIALAVSFVTGCEYCVKSHSKILEKEGMTKKQIHEALRIASIFNTLRFKY